MVRTKYSRELGFIGGGNMAEAIVQGVLATGQKPERVIVAEPIAQRRSYLTKRFRVCVTSDNAEAARTSATLVLAVKPQVVDEVLAELSTLITPAQLVISIAAGVPLARLRKPLRATTRVVRVMPNTPCLLGRGASVVCGGDSAQASDLRAVKSLFETVGKAFVLNDERLLDAVTGLSGSGPAYVYAFAEALIAGGVRAGLEEPLASELVLETVAGAAEMMLRSGRSPAELRQAVTSPRGTTQAGLEELGRRGFGRTVGAAVLAATRRSRQLGRGRT
jgi:pyrroline-5-carboxylate reductase